jgi:geranylgeranyl diphosphate synthase type II
VTVPEVLDAERAVVEVALQRLLPLDDEWPARLHRAIRYAVFAGGKRIRPILCRLAHAAAGGRPDDITEAACGIELIHTYSLVHDDLPALDDDTLRRGQLTVHMAFDEATAILVGDALLAHGLLLLARHPKGSEWAARRACATEAVSEAISSVGMVGGQMDDLEATGQIAADDRLEPALRLERIHRHKTGCLLRAAVEAGAILAGSSDDERVLFRRYGDSLGLAFQVADDLLDATATADELGKSVGKDAAAGKLTFVTLYGLEASRRRLEELGDELVALAAEIEGPDGALAAVARYVVDRRS